MATAEYFTEVFHEWILSTALSKSLLTSGTKDQFDTQNIWDRRVVWPSPNFDRQRTFSEIFGENKPLTVYPEGDFTIADADDYKFANKARYRDTYQWMRPDFTIQDKSISTLVFLEAKGGDVPAKTWKNPKELKYYNFLDEVGVEGTKGFYYIVPAKSADPCKKCLIDNFQSKTKIKSGMIIWEELLDLIDGKLLETCLDDILRDAKSLQRLRDWQTNRKTS